MATIPTSTASLPAPAPRVDVADREVDVLFLVIQYLRALGLSSSVVALLRESGVDPFWLCGPSRELAVLREWIFRGEWAQVRALLHPLRAVAGDHGYAQAMTVVDKQLLLEEFYLTDASELQNCVRMLGSDGTRAAGWSLDEARLACFASLVPLFRGEIDDDDDESKYQRMPQRQLVALLNDAQLLHKKRDDDGGGDGGGTTDLVSMTPTSSDEILSSDTESKAAVSSLRLAVATSSQATARGAAAAPSWLLTRSIDLSAVRKTRAVPSLDPHRHDAQHRLAMSVDFSARGIRSSRRQQLRSGPRQGLAKMIGEDSTTHDDGETRLGDAGGRPSRVDAEAQTDALADAIAPVLSTSDAAVETDAEFLQEVARTSVEIFPPTGEIEESKLAVDNTQDPRASTTLDQSELRLADAPLEAWCAARHGHYELEPQEEQDETVQSPESAEVEDPSHEDDDRFDPIHQDDVEEEEEEDWGDMNDEPIPLRSYSQLTLDSVVRAHVVAQVREAQAIRAMDIAPDGSEMVIGTNARALRVFDLMEPLSQAMATTKTTSRSILPLLPVSLERHKHHSSSIYVATYNHISPAHATPLIATGAAESSIKVLARWTQQELWIRGHGGKCRALQFASSTLLCSTASGDLVIRAWDLESSNGTQCVQRFDGHVGEIQALAIKGSSSNDSSSGHLDRRCFVSSSMDRTVRLWDLRSAQCARVLARTASPAFSLAFQPTDAATSVLLATGHQDGSVALWDLRTGSSKPAKPLATITHHQDECRAVSWSPDGRWLLSAAFNGTLCLLDASVVGDLSAVASFRQHDDKILQAQWHPTQPALITTGADKLVKLWGFA